MSYIDKKVKREVKEFIEATLREKVAVLTPANLRKQDILKRKPAHIDNQKWIDNCRRIVHSIIRLTYDNRYEDKSDGFVPLFSPALKQLSGNAYPSYIKGLIDAGIIETDGQYSKARHKSLGYRLTEKYLTHRTFLGEGHY